MAKKRIIIVGAGPGGLTAGMILAKRGFDVEIFEKENVVGGRNAPIKRNGFTFDIGPTFLMMNFILEDVFEETGRKAYDYLEFKKLEPMYRLHFGEKEFLPTTDHDKMIKELERVFPGEVKGYERFMKEEGKRFEMMFPCLQKDYSYPSSLVRPVLLKALPYLALDKSLYRNLSRYFSHELLRLSFTFQSKYLGMSAWECPAAFTIIPYVEHGFGIYHVQGGLNMISDAMAKVIEEEGGKIHLNSPVEKVITKNRKAKGIELKSGEKIEADDVVLNADFSHAVQNLFDDGVIKKYTQGNLMKRKYSCSTFMMYLGLKKKYNIPHHNVFFAGDYKKNIDDIFKNKVLSKEMSFYVQNASITDSTLAPEGKSAVYVLVPVPNLKGDIDWERQKYFVREKILKSMEEKAGMRDIRENIEEEIIYTPDTWQSGLNVFLGATFNLGHNIPQMLYFRPKNKFEEVDNVYLTGGGTHPGSGLPTIYESGRISANLICKKHKVPYKEPGPFKSKETVAGSGV